MTGTDDPAEETPKVTEGTFMRVAMTLAVYSLSESLTLREAWEAVGDYDE